MFTIDKKTVLGALKLPDRKIRTALNAKTQLVQMSKGMRGYSWIPMICGVLLTVMVIGAFVGIPAFLVGLWSRIKSGKNLKIADETLEEYLQSIGVKVGSLLKVHHNPCRPQHRQCVSEHVSWQIVPFTAFRFRGKDNGLNFTVAVCAFSNRSRDPLAPHP